MTIEFGKINASFNGKSLGTLFESVRINFGSRQSEFIFSLSDKSELKASIDNVLNQETIYRAIREQLEKTMEQFRNGATEVKLIADGRIIGVLTRNVGNHA